MSLNAVVSKEDKLKNHIIDLQLAFNEFDKLGDGVNGKITVDKLGQILRTQLNEIKSDEELAEMIARYNLTESGFLTFREFLHMMEEAEGKDDDKGEMNDGLALLERGGDGLTRATLKNIFDVFDKDKDGFVSAEEFKAVLDDQGESMSENEVAGLMHLADPTNSNKISYAAFAAIMTGMSLE